MGVERTRSFSRITAVLLGLLLASCSFSEGPDWPPLTVLEPAEEAPANAAPGSAAAASQQPSLAGLLGGEAAEAAPGGGTVLVGLIRPLVVIRFPDSASVAYEDTLYQAVKAALERRPQTAFDLVAVTDGLRPGDHAVVSDRARAVLRSLAAMGLPPERLSLSAASLPGVAGSEVHLYVR